MSRNAMQGRMARAAMLLGVALAGAACGVADPGPSVGAVKAAFGLKDPTPTALGERQTWGGELVADGDGYALEGRYVFVVDAARPVTLEKLYGAAACMGDAVVVAKPDFRLTSADADGEPAAGALAPGADRHPLGVLPPGAYDLSFRVEASAPCSIALAFVAQPA